MMYAIGIDLRAEVDWNRGRALRPRMVDRISSKNAIA
jgi:hypothetical protein